MPTRGHSMNSINTPEVEDVPTIRRSSYVGVMSPEVEGGPKPPLEQDGFYVLKKDSQRRKTLSEVLTEDESNICLIWMELIPEETEIIEERHLKILIKILRDYIVDPNKNLMEASINNLKNSFQNDENLNHLQLALYSFQDAVNNVLRSRKIKPHWMFALDNLIRTAVEAAITVISPEFGNHLAQERFFDGHTVRTPSVNSSSTVNSQNSLNYTNKSRYKCQLNSLRTENSKLMQENLEIQKNLLTLLTQMSEEHRYLVDILKNLIEIMSALGQKNVKKESTPEISILQVDNKLVEWLQSCNLDDLSIQKFIAEQYTLEDVRNYMARDDLRRINLPGGVELRLWKDIMNWRKEHRPLSHSRKPSIDKNISNNLNH